MRNIITLICLFIGTHQLFAQDISTKNLRLGFEVAPQFSWMNTTDNKINGNGTNLGVRLSFDAEIFFSETYAFTTGLIYSLNEGGTLYHEVGGNLLPDSKLSDEALAALGSERQFADKTNIQYKLQYLQIPFALKMRTREFGYIRYFAQLPEFTIGFPVKSRGKFTNDNTGMDLENELIGKDVTSINIYWGIGGGIEYTISESASFVAGLHFQQSFIDVSHDDGNKNTGKAEDSKANIGTIQLRIGVLF